MVRFFVDKDKFKNYTATIDGQEYLHAKAVCRLREEDEIDLINGDGYVYSGEVFKIYNDKIEVKINKKEKIDTEPKVGIILFQSVVKSDKFDLIVEKAVELGVSRIVPLYTARTQYELSKEKTERLKKIIKSAVCQCGRAVTPVLSKPVKLSEIMSHIKPYYLNIFLNEKETDPSNKIKNILEKNKNLIDQIPAEVNFILGPEGGFTEEEAKFLKENGVISASLGRRILRAETAAIAALAVLLSEIEN